MENSLKDKTLLVGTIERMLSGEICIEGIRVSSLLNHHIGKRCSIVIEVTDDHDKEAR